MHCSKGKQGLLCQSLLAMLSLGCPEAFLDSRHGAFCECV